MLSGYSCPTYNLETSEGRGFVTIKNCNCESYPFFFFFLLVKQYKADAALKSLVIILSHGLRTISVLALKFCTN